MNQSNFDGSSSVRSSGSCYSGSVMSARRVHRIWNIVQQEIECDNPFDHIDDEEIARLNYLPAGEIRKELIARGSEGTLKK